MRSDSDTQPDPQAAWLAKFVRFAGVGGMTGGGLRVLAAFLPWRRESVPLELLAVAIDVGLLLGLAALLIVFGQQLGRLGIAGLALAFFGVASVVGPDAVAFGMDFYYAGAATVGLGIAALGAAGLRSGMTPRWAFAAWTAVPALAIAGALTGNGEAGFVAAGVALGLGFVGLGRNLARFDARVIAGVAVLALCVGTGALPVVADPGEPHKQPETGAKENPIMELNQVTLPARDLDDSVEFFERFGLTLIVYSPENSYARFEIPGGHSTLSLHVESEPVRGPSAQIYFETSDPASRIAELAERGIRPVQPLEAKSWLWTEAWFVDPAGNQIALYSAGENRKNPPWRLKNGRK